MRYRHRPALGELEIDAAQDAAKSSSHLSWKAPGRIAGMSGAVVNPFDFHQKRESFVEDGELVGTGDDEDDSFLDSARPRSAREASRGAAQPSVTPTPAVRHLWMLTGS